jgi:hypothetical protein
MINGQPRVVAVVCTYWPNREPNVLQILRDLAASTRRPDRVVVLNNGRFPWEHPAPPVLDVQVIHSYNTTCRGKFIAALFEPADYYLLLDDDTSVGRTTLETLLQHAHRGICTGYLGCMVAPNGSVHTGGRLWPHDATAVTAVDTFCGCAMFMAFDSLVRMLQLEERVRLDGEWPHQGDDILAGLANRSEVVPLQGEAKFVDLGARARPPRRTITGCGIFTTRVIQVGGGGGSTVSVALTQVMSGPSRSISFVVVPRVHPR